MKPNTPPPKRSDGKPLPPLEIVEPLNRFGQGQTLANHLRKASRLFAAGKWEKRKAAFLADILPQLQKSRLWWAFDLTVAALPPELAADFLTAVGPGLALRWAKSDLERHRTAAAAWLRAHWDGLSADDRKTAAELLDRPSVPPSA